MSYPLRFLIVLSLAIFVFSCSSSTNETNELDQSYFQKWEDYHLGPASRKGYMKIVGLYELDETSTNTFGSDSTNDHVLTIPGTPKVLGYTLSYADSVHFKAAKDIIITNEEGDTLKDVGLELDQYGNSKPLFHDRIKWIVKTFGDQRYLRVWDMESESYESFKGYQRFEPSSKFIISGTYTPYPEPKMETVPNSLGYAMETSFIGKISFDFEGGSYTMDVQTDGFLMIADETSGVSTYGSGRYLYVDLPKAGSGPVTMDLNFIYNPPCSYSKYTTCQFPAEGNRYPFAIEAGEKIDLVTK